MQHKNINTTFLQGMFKNVNMFQQSPKMNLNSQKIFGFWGTAWVYYNSTLMGYMSHKSGSFLIWLNQREPLTRLKSGVSATFSVTKRNLFPNNIISHACMQSPLSCMLIMLQMKLCSKVRAAQTHCLCCHGNLHGFTISSKAHLALLQLTEHRLEDWLVY